MSNPELPPPGGGESNPAEAPLPRRLDPADYDQLAGDPPVLAEGEIDFSGRTHQPEDLADVIGDAIVEAQASGGEIPDWGARAIARSLANQYDETTALHNLAVTGEGEYEPIRDEAMAIYNTGRARPHIRRQIDYLLTYLLARQRKRESAADEPEPEPDPELSDNAKDGLQSYGNAFRAFLKLDDIEPDRNDLVELFQDVYIGSFSTMNDVVAGLTPWTEWVEAVEELQERMVIPGQIRLDYVAAVNLAKDTYDLVELDGMLYAFEK